MDKFEKSTCRTILSVLESRMRRVKDIDCEKCGQGFSASEHTQCPRCAKPENTELDGVGSEFNSINETQIN